MNKTRQRHCRRGLKYKKFAVSKKNILYWQDLLLWWQFNFGMNLFSTTNHYQCGLVGLVGWLVWLAWLVGWQFVKRIEIRRWAGSRSPKTGFRLGDNVQRKYRNTLVYYIKYKYKNKGWNKNCSKAGNESNKTGSQLDNNNVSCHHTCCYNATTGVNSECVQTSLNVVRLLKHTHTRIKVTGLKSQKRALGGEASLRQQSGVISIGPPKTRRLVISQWSLL